MSEDSVFPDVKYYYDPVIIQKLYPNLSIDDAIFVRDLFCELSHTVYFELAIKRKIKHLEILVTNPFSKTTFFEIAIVGVLNDIVRLL